MNNRLFMSHKTGENMKSTLYLHLQDMGLLQVASPALESLVKMTSKAIVLYSLFYVTASIKLHRYAPTFNHFILLQD